MSYISHLLGLVNLWHEMEPWPFTFPKNFIVFFYKIVHAMKLIMLIFSQFKRISDGWCLCDNWNILVIKIQTIPFVFAHLAIVSNLGVNLLLKLFWYFILVLCNQHHMNFRIYQLLWKHMVIKAKIFALFPIPSPLMNSMTSSSWWCSTFPSCSQCQNAFFITKTFCNYVLI